jgi:hypothetical protein
MVMVISSSVAKAGTHKVRHIARAKNMLKILFFIQYSYNYLNLAVSLRDAKLEMRGI